MRKVLANPAEMIAHGAPRLIHNDQELAAYTEALFELTALDNPSRSEAEAIELLTLLVNQLRAEHVTLSLLRTRFLSYGSSLNTRALYSVI